LSVLFVETLQHFAIDAEAQHFVRDLKVVRDQRLLGRSCVHRANDKKTGEKIISTAYLHEEIIG
jgi:hypothetical protein